MRVILIPPELPLGLRETYQMIRPGGRVGEMTEGGRLRSMNIFRMTDGGNKYSVATQTLPIYPWTK